VGIPLTTDTSRERLLKTGCTPATSSSPTTRRTGAAMGCPRRRPGRCAVPSDVRAKQREGLQPGQVSEHAVNTSSQTVHRWRHGGGVEEIRGVGKRVTPDRRCCGIGGRSTMAVLAAPWQPVAGDMRAQKAVGADEQLGCVQCDLPSPSVSTRRIPHQAGRVVVEAAQRLRFWHHLIQACKKRSGCRCLIAAPLAVAA